MRKALADHEVLAWIEGYAQCEISLDDLYQRVRAALGQQMIHNPHYRVVNLNQICSNRVVRITPQHIEILLGKRQRGEITEREMKNWAHMIQINDAYFWAPEDADVVGKWVNYVSFDFTPED